MTSPQGIDRVRQALAELQRLAQEMRDREAQAQARQRAAYEGKRIPRLILAAVGVLIACFPIYAVIVGRVDFPAGMPSLYWKDYPYSFAFAVALEFVFAAIPLVAAIGLAYVGRPRR
jgi:hypothetical protein